jgi:hypothetical protein
MMPCLDPLHSVSARPSIDGSKTVYEAVNKESRKNFFIGMHNEFVGTRAPRAAAFCCFKAAETGGEVSERSVRALRKTSILAMDLAKWLQTAKSTAKLTLFHSIRLARLVRSCFNKTAPRFARRSF